MEAVATATALWHRFATGVLRRGHKYSRRGPRSCDTQLSSARLFRRQRARQM